MKKQFIGILFFIFSFIFIFSQTQEKTIVEAYYSCGQGPCNSTYPCNAGLTCPPARICGTMVDSCSGATCVNDAVWDASTCVNRCTNPGTTRTVSWGTCSATCGNGTMTCNCGSENNCAVACTNPAGACSSTSACCVNQAPNSIPTVVSVAQNPCSSPPSVLVSWSFSGSLSGCGEPWGYDCTSQNNTFRIELNGYPGNTLSGISSGSTSSNFTVPDWGSYELRVCADNSALSTCSSWYPFTITAPICGVFGQSQTSSPVTAPANCYAVFPNLSASHDTCSDETQFYVMGGGLQTCASSWLPSQPASYASCTPATGSYRWDARSHDTGPAPYTCVSPTIAPTPPVGQSINIDITAPTPPSGIFLTPVVDGTCLTKYFLTYDWNTTTDTGCAGLYPGTPYQGQIATDALFTNIVDDTGWTGSTQLTTSTSYDGGTTIYGRSRARDSVENVSSWYTAAETTIVIPTPTAYPTIHLWGNYTEDTATDPSNEICGGNMTINPSELSISLTINPPEGTSYNCNVGATQYDCYITVQNQTTDCVVPNHTIIPNFTYSGYETIEYRTASTCDGDTTSSIDVVTDGGVPVPTPANIFFRYGSQSWFKATATSFINKQQRNNIIPNLTTAFDGDDSVLPPNNKYLILGNAGSTLYGATKSIDLGPNATLGFSEHNWVSTTYDANTLYTPLKFADYVKSRKQYFAISDINEITTDGIYYSSSDLVINDTNKGVFNNKKVILLADKNTVSIQTVGASPEVSIFSPQGGSVAIIAKNIVINGNVTQIDAILIGGSGVDIGSSQNKLKVNGNLIDLSGNFNHHDRRLENANTPSLFIKVNYQTYLNLLPYMSISLYDWRQVQ